jgi:predicted acyltransferase (DUF342 family)
MPDNQDLELQRAAVGADFAIGNQTAAVAVQLTINVPDYATVRRSSITGQVEIDQISLDDLVSLRDSIAEQITAIQEQLARQWESL